MRVEVIATDVDELPEWARTMIRKLRSENAGLRVDLREARRELNEYRVSER